MTGRRVTVVGGGIAGLVAASYAGRAGAEVLVLEGVSEPGGRARTRSRGGFHFNMGPHALYRASAAGRVLGHLGIRPDGAAPALSGALARHDGRLHALPGGLLSLLTTGLLRPSEKLETARWLAGLAKLDTSALDAVPLDEALASQLRHERVRALALALTRLSGYHHAPALLSAGAALRQLQLSLGGVLYLHGGWASLVARLAETARRSGATLRCGARVRGVYRDGAGHAVELQDGQTLGADAVVLATSPRDVAKLVDGGGDPELAKEAAESIPVRAASLDLGLAKLPAPRRGFALGIDEPTYFSVHSLAARLAPEGGALIHAARYLAPGEEPSREDLSAELEALTDAMQPGWRGALRESSLLTHLPVSHRLVTAATGGLAGRPGVALPGRSGLFRAGDWVGDEGMLADASFASGRLAGLRAAGGGSDGVAA